MNTRKDFISSFSLMIVLSITTICGYSQQNVGLTMNKILYSQKPSISSPNEAALEKYIEFPVANYTGVPDISIPIHEINVKGLKIPIGLSYHASGIKVDEVASDVGIGWALNTGGGNINILNNGLIDEISNYPLNDPGMFQKIKTLNLVPFYQGGIIDCTTAMMYFDETIFGPDKYNLYSGGDMPFLQGVIRGYTDGEPDLYTFSFLGRSGKFFLDENAVFRTIPYSEIKIERFLVNGFSAGYKLTDENGIIYEFKEKIESGVYTTNNSVGSMSPEYLRETISRSYNLTKITTPIGETVEFFYTSYPLTYNRQKIFSKATFGSSLGQPGCYQFNNGGNGLFYTSNASNRQEGGGNRIESIKASDGTLVKFLYSSTDRTDLPGSKTLEKIQVWSFKMGQNMFNEFILAQDYSVGGRLTLKSLKESTKPASQFTYNNTILPERLSYSQDTFGFYNGKPNINTLLPIDEYHEFWEGADRSIVPVLTQAGMLTKIIHPTGGSTEYVYEPNEVYVSQNTYKYPKTIGAYLVSSPDQTVSANFTITSNSQKIRMNRIDTWDGTTIHNDYCLIHLYGPNNYHQTFAGNSSLNTPPLNLTPGQYTLSIETVGSTYYAEVTFYWFEQTLVPPHNEIAGGVRIKEIKKYDRDGNIALLKKYEYKQSGTNNSSGVINVEPIFTTYQDQTMFYTPMGYSTCASMSCQYLAQNSNSAGPLTYANGSYVLYNEVTTYMRDKTQNGYSNYKYNVTNEGFNSLPAFPYAPSVPYDWVNGVLLEQTDYAYKNPQFVPIKKTKNFYNYNNFDPVINTAHLYKTYGAKIAAQQEPKICFTPCLQDPPLWGTELSNCSFGIQGYKFYSSWHRLDKTEETIYDENGNNPLTNSVNYYYDNSTRIAQTRVETHNSKGDLIKTLLKYPFDFPNDAVYNGMVAKNIITPVIEQSNFKNISFLQSTRANFNFWNNGWGVNNTNSLIVPQTVEATILNYPTETRQQINRYDVHGNIQEVQKPNDVKEVYIYGYNSNYPVAKVIGSDYVTVSGLVNQVVLDNVDGLYTDAQIKAQLNNIRAGLANTKALVTTYTYFPFVGMASETDPSGKTIFYEYDNLNRLALVRDKDNNILKKICYNYHGQPEDCITSSCTNTSPNWQNTTTVLRCQKDLTGQNTGNQEQEQVDINSCSLSYNQTQWVSVGQNTSVCPLPVYVNLTSTNVTGATGYTASYFNTATNHTYTFTVPATTGLQSLGAVPEGNYTLTISRTSGSQMYGTFKSGCFKQVITGTSATFFNVAVSTATCNSITVDISGVE